VAAKHYLQVTEEHFAKAAHVPTHFITQLVGMDRNTAERKCENPADFENPRGLVVVGMGDEGSELLRQCSDFRVSGKCAAKINAILTDSEFADALLRIAAAAGVDTDNR
jgi:hypothetical protein